MTDADRWKKAMDKEMIGISEHDVADLVTIESLPPGVKPIGSRWVFKIKTTGDLKARLDVQGWGQHRLRKYVRTAAVWCKISRTS